MVPKVVPVTLLESGISNLSGSLPRVPQEVCALLTLLDQSFSVLNASKPNMYQACWLCYDTVPPYYKKIEVMGSYSNTPKASKCRWQSKAQLTLQQVMGKVLYLGIGPSEQQVLCYQTLKLPTFQDYLIPNRWWFPDMPPVFTNMALTPC